MGEGTLPLLLSDIVKKLTIDVPGGRGHSAQKGTAADEIICVFCHIDKWCFIWYNNSVKRGSRGNKDTGTNGANRWNSKFCWRLSLEKSCKFFQKPLDKHHNLWYNNNVKRGWQKSRWSTISDVCKALNKQVAIKKIFEKLFKNLLTNHEKCGIICM